MWGATDTAVRVNGQLKAGIAWFAVEPKINGAGKVEGKIKKKGYIALANNNLTYPAIAQGTNGNGAIAFTVVGADYFPSVASGQRIGSADSTCTSFGSRERRVDKSAMARDLILSSLISGVAMMDVTSVGEEISAEGGTDMGCGLQELKINIVTMRA